MLYSFAKILMTAGLRFFYRHIYTTGFENVPPKGPVIIIANHNSSLMDAALLGILLTRKAYFFARGDVFVNKPIQKILWWFHMMPVHGYQRGRNTLSVNSDSFSEGRQILMKGGIIVFFPESTSHTEHQLWPFRKGVFRLAFDTAAAAGFSFDIPIVPVGITYDHPVACRTSVQVHAGKPLWISAYTDEYRQNSAAALLHICKDAHRTVHQLVLHITDKKRLQTAEHCITISRTNHRAAAPSWRILSAEKLAREQNICSDINNAHETDFEKKKKQLEEYFNSLSAAGLTDTSPGSTFSFPGWKRIMLWLCFPFYAAGLLLNGLPVLIARRVVDKKVYRKDFYSWIFVVCYSFIYFFWLALVVVVSSLFGWQWAVGLPALMVVTGLVAYVYLDWLHERRQKLKWQLLPGETKKELNTVRTTIQQGI